jgi:hypothetical protein
MECNLACDLISTFVLRYIKVRVHSSPNIIPQDPKFLTSIFTFNHRHNITTATVITTHIFINSIPLVPKSLNNSRC